jgi:hypothetical protein
VRRVPGIAAFAVLFQMLAIGLSGPPTNASTNDATVERPTEVPSESALNLRYQLQAILKAAAANESQNFDQLVADLRVPDSANWFTATFGDEIGRKLASTYSDSWNDYKRDVNGMFRDSGTSKHTRAFVEEYSASSLPHRDAFIRSILLNAKVPLVLYTAGAGALQKSDVLPGVYVFAQGRFRVVNWRTFYELPNVDPMRIQVERRVAPQPIQGIEPVLPSDPNRPQIHDTVIIHVVIDRDGVVALAEAESGPPELFISDVRGVRLFRFEPQTRHGAPVEIDTTIPVSHAEATIKLQ